MTYAEAFLQEYVSMIEERLNELSNKLTKRVAVPDYSEYCFVSGQINGLREVLDMRVEAKRKLDER